MTNFEKVGEFHRKFDLETIQDGPPQLVSDKLHEFRRWFIQEELDEFVEAHRVGDLAKVADALADILYVTYGTAHLYHIPIDAVFAEVQRANMMKVRALGDDDPLSVRKSKFDVVKPPGWQPPDIESVLANHSVRNKWIDRYMELAKHIATWSKDPSMQVGAVLIGKDRREIAHGFNGFPPGIADSKERLMDRPTRYALTQHAERNVLDNAQFNCGGGTIVVTAFPCVECAKSIIAKKIATVVCPPAPAPNPERPWTISCQLSEDIMKEAGIEIVTLL